MYIQNLALAKITFNMNQGKGNETRISKAKVAETK